MVLALVMVAFGVLALRVVQLQTADNEKLRIQGDKRYLREVKVFPQRGRILDRNGQVLSISTPVDSVVAEPRVFCKEAALWQPLVEKMDMSRKKLQKKCEKFADAGFMYIKRRMPPAVVEQVMTMKIPGVEVRREYKRYYPGGPVSAHLIGFTDIDEHGQEGLERTFDAELSGQEGRTRLLKDLAGHYVESVESIRQVRHGKDLVISIDQRVQSLASRYLESAISQHDASGGGVVVLEIPSGEIIAMVNAPQFNPNNRSSITTGVFRNRTVTDILEPGSTVKPFTIAMALESGEVDADTLIDTAPGYYQLPGHTIRDVHNYGEISVFDVVVHSSNVGTAKLALRLPLDDLYNTFRDVGFGVRAATLPGEISGVLTKRTRKLEHAALSYGYGFSTTLLQLARAYTVFATDGMLLPVTLERRASEYRASGQRVFSADTVAHIRAMLEQVATPQGTAHKARVARYRVGGKTGTTHKLINGSYDNKHYISLFAGLAPLTEPKFVMVVAIDDPRGKLYYGGDVAAPVFSSLMTDLMRLYNVKPDDIAPSKPTRALKKDNKV